MEQSWDNWPLHTEMEMEMENDGNFLEQCHADDDDDFLRGILQQPDFSSENESQSFHHPSPIVHNNFTASVACAGSSISYEETDTDRRGRGGKRPRPAASSSTPRTFILSFDNSTIIPATPEQSYSTSTSTGGYHQHQQTIQLELGGLQGTPSNSNSNSNSPLSSNSSKKRSLQDHKFEPKTRSSQGPKKSRSDSQTLDHIMAERKRRQELTERFIALSATIPGLKKTDKASILREAINYVKQLQERVTELEKRNKRGPESIIFLKKTDVSSANEDSTSSETSSEDCCRPSSSELLPDVEARVLEKEVLIEIHCEKQNGIELKILDHLENLHLSVTGSSVLPFGNSTLGITVIAQMGDAYRMTVNDLVKNLRAVMLNQITTNTDPY